MMPIIDKKILNEKEKIFNEILPYLAYDYDKDKRYVIDDAPEGTKEKYEEYLKLVKKLLNWFLKM